MQFDSEAYSKRKAFLGSACERCAVEPLSQFNWKQQAAVFKTTDS